LELTVLLLFLLHIHFTKYPMCFQDRNKVFFTTFDLSDEYYCGHCQLSETYLAQMTSWKQRQLLDTSTDATDNEKCQKILLLLNAIGLSPGGSGYFTCTQIKKKKVTRKFKSGGLHEKHVVTTWKFGNHLSIRL
jgi:hypothetical protein